MTADFYERLAPYYDLLFEDWEVSSTRQAAQLDAVIQAAWGPPPRRVLDAAAGIGTQAIDLAARGYHVTASDIAPAAITRAAAEATRRGLRLATAVADLRFLDTVHGPHDVVLACDNALPHLLTDTDIQQALSACYRCLVPGGGLLVSLRDYPSTPRRGQETHPYGDRYRDGKHYQLFQVWEWDGPCYDFALHIRIDAGLPTEHEVVLRSRYYAISAPKSLSAHGSLRVRGGWPDRRRVLSTAPPCHPRPWDLTQATRESGDGTRASTDWTWRPGATPV